MASREHSHACAMNVVVTTCYEVRQDHRGQQNTPHSKAGFPLTPSSLSFHYTGTLALFIPSSGHQLQLILFGPFVLQTLEI